MTSSVLVASLNVLPTVFVEVTRCLIEVIGSRRRPNTPAA